MMRGVVPLVFLASLPLAAGPAADLAKAIRDNRLDREECYRVRDLTLIKEDIRIYLTDGYLIFSKPVAGRPIAAVFTTEVENGDGEVILLPPTLAERRSLAAYTGSPALDEHFQTALFFFTGDIYRDLKAQIPNNPTNRKAPEMGALLDEAWSPLLRSIGETNATRLTLDLLDAPGRKADLLTAVFRNGRLGTFDIFFDPDGPDQIAAGQLAERQNRTYFDVWTHFPSRAARARKTPAEAQWSVNDYRIQATVGTDLSLSAVTRMKVKTAAETLGAVAFEIAREMAVSAVTVDGKAAEVLQQEAIATTAGRSENELVLVVPPEPLRSGREYEFEFHHSGKVIVQTGDRIFYVTARGNWYPGHGTQAATFDLTFRYPRGLELVTAGDIVEDRTEGEWRTTRRRPTAAIGMAGFNLGDYAHARVSRSGFVVDVCANRTLEAALQPRPQPPPAIALPVPSRGRGGRTSNIELPPLPPPANPLARLETLASDVISALEFMASKFGPPAVPHLTVSPIPATFGQGFPGLIYLSTRSYVNSSEAHLGPDETLFFDDLLQAHETAHQWWGGMVYSPGYRDDWLLEAMANYSALLYLEKRKGSRELETMLENYRAALLSKSENGQSVDAAGPIVLGTRLESSIEPRAWRAITYGKGSWIIQMLRQKMGDERFFAMLAEVFKRYAHRTISTEEFRALAAQFLPPKSDDPKLESFFDQWVYSTGIPTLKLSYSLKGQAPAVKLVGKLTQSDVPEDFSVLTPVEIQLGRGQNITRWLRSSSDPVTFTVDLKQAPLKVMLDPHYAVLRR